MEDQSGIVRLTIAVLGGCILIILAGLVVIAVRNDGQVASDIVGTFTQLATTGLAGLSAIITAYVIAHRPTAASVALATVTATAPASTADVPPNGASEPATAEG